MAAHLVTPRKIRLSSRVELVPQLGHEHPLVALAFAPERALFAALDARPSVHVWSVDAGDVLLIAPLPAGEFDAVRWLADDRIAVRQRVEDDEGGVWWARSAHSGDRWRPVRSLEELAPELAVKRRLERVAAGGWQVVHEDGRSGVLAGSAQATRGELDPLGRFAALLEGASVLIFDADRGTLLHRTSPAPEAAAWLDLAVTSGGERVITLGADGWLEVFDPMRPAEPMRLGRVREATCLAIDEAAHIAVGDAGGQITLLSREDGQRLLRTPKCVRGFVWETALAEQVGYVGARRESFGAYLEPEHAIHPVRPLPGPASAVCAGVRWPLLLAALEDGRLFELDLAGDTVSELARAPWPLRQLAASHYGAVGVGEGGSWWFDGERAEVQALESPQSVCCVAVERKGGVAAFGYASRIVVQGSNGKVQSVLEGITSPRAMAFLRYRNRRTLVVVDAARVLWRFELGKGNLVRGGVIELGSRAPASLSSLVVDEDDTLRALVESDNGHRAVVLLDVQSAQATLLLGVVVYGHHVVALYDDEGTWLRQDEQRAVRMVSELHADEPHDWLRRPEPGVA